MVQHVVDLPPLTKKELSPKFSRARKKKPQKRGRKPNLNPPRPKIYLATSPLLGSKEFRPNNTQMQFAQIFLKRMEGEMEGDISPWKILRDDMKMSSQNWWRWKQNPKFVAWFLALRENFHNTLGR